MKEHEHCWHFKRFANVVYEKHGIYKPTYGGIDFPTVESAENEYICCLCGKTKIER